jgi:membrane fusion protein (multidrug efflux system)
MPAFRIVSLNDLTFKANLSEAYVPLVKRGDVVSITFPSINQTITAKVASMGQTINPSNRTLSLLVDIPGNTPNIKANMIGEISINDASRTAALTVPQEYLQKGADGSFVMVAERDSAGSGYVARKVLVQTGLRYENEVEAISGLKLGHLLITDGNVVEGDKVTFPGVAPQQ